MKNISYLLLILFVFTGFIPSSSSKSVTQANKTLKAKDNPADSSIKSAIQGSWMLVEENGHVVVRKQIKHYTDKYFIWHTMDKHNIIRVSVSGEYIIQGNNLFEIMEMTTLNNIEFKGNTAKIEIKIDKDTLYQNIVIPMQDRENRFTEKWIRIK